MVCYMACHHWCIAVKALIGSPSPYFEVFELSIGVTSMSTGTMPSGSAPGYISILNLVLGTVLSHIHVVKFFGEIAFAKQCSYDRKATCRNDSLVCIFDNYVTVFKCNMTVMIHDIFLAKPLIYWTIVS